MASEMEHSIDGGVDRVGVNGQEGRHQIGKGGLNKFEYQGPDTTHSVAC